jgi:uncharacterized membrane protein
VIKILRCVFFKIIFLILKINLGFIEGSYLKNKNVVEAILLKFFKRYFNLDLHQQNESLDYIEFTQSI